MANVVWNVLLVDDSPEYLFLFSECAKELHLPINLYLVQGALAAMNLLAQQGPDLGKPTPDLILTDLNMPGISGLQFLELLKNSQWRDIPVVLHSTTARVSDHRNAKNLGAIDCWTKPGLWDELLTELPKIMTYLGNSHVEGVGGGSSAS